MEAVAQEILAWRGWYVSLENDDLCLVSLAHAVRWEGPTLTADKVPAEDSPHGIYALAREDGYPRDPYKSTGLYWPPTTYKAQAAVWGQVALSGIVVVGENGYRAERAVIRSLQIIQHHPNVIPLLDMQVRLEERYKCPVEIAESALWRAKVNEWHRVSQVRLVQSNSSQGSAQYWEAQW